MRYYAHSNGENKADWQTLKEHLENTAKLVEEFANNFCDNNIAYNIGVLHDIGKYQQDFQKKLDGENIKIEHSIAGAIQWNELVPGFLLPQYCIACHHTGLIDIGTQSDNEADGTLCARLKHKVDDYSFYQNEILLNKLNKEDIAQNLMKMANCNNEYSFYIRFMFSCLVDADFLDTEKFYNPQIQRGNYVDFAKALDEINEYIDEFTADTLVKKTRNELRMQVLENSKNDANIYYLNLPTGSGKTLTSMQFALNRAVLKNKKRIIYVIPYTSIIKQNAKVFKNIFGEDSVLEHHSNFDYGELEEVDDDFLTQKKLQKASENWDASIIVTTNVQFFESIYNNKSSKLRKLHNIANSIIIFDEVHTMPINFFQPCLEAINILTEKYNCEAVLMSATMPDFNIWLNKFNGNTTNSLDLVCDKTSFNVFERNKIVNLGEISLDKLVYDMSNSNLKTLIVVNKKKTAKIIYDKLNCKKYHLSTYMTDNDRTKIIAKINEDLNKEEPFVVVSTSLIEAGVDFDFEVAYRELMGLENLIQTAGRCNREGKRKNAVTYSFEFLEDEYKTKAEEVKIKQTFTREIFEKFDNVLDINAISKYFNRLYSYKQNNMSMMDFSMDKYTTSKGFNFKTYAKDFKLIQDDMMSVVIINDGDDVLNIMHDIQFNARISKRKLQKYVVNLHKWEYESLLKMGVLNEVNGIMYLANEKLYSNETGILFEDNFDYIF